MTDSQGQLQEVRVIRFRAQSRWLFISVLLVAALAASLPYAFSFELSAALKSLLLISFGVAVFTLFIVPFARWLAKTTTITTHRIFLRSGVLTTLRQEVSFEQIAEIKLRRSLLQRMSGSGDILIRTSAGANMVLTNVPSLKIIAQAIQDLLHY